MPHIGLEWEAIEVSCWQQKFCLELYHFLTINITTYINIECYKCLAEDVGIKHLGFGAPMSHILSPSLRPGLLRSA